MAEIHLKAYGKINLSLDVTGVREDGYHQLETVMQRISLYDKIHLVWTPCAPWRAPMICAQSGASSGDLSCTSSEGISIQVTTNRSYLPTDARNLAYQAAALMWDRFGQKTCGDCGRGEVSGGGQKTCGGTLEISIEKRIPVSAGLAGGSSNAAAVLIGLNRLWRLGLDTRTLCSLGETLGSDVPFCVLVQNTRFQGALATGRGEVLRPLRHTMRKYLVLAKPSFGVSTKEVFRHIDEYSISQRPDSGKLMKGLARREDKLVYENMINVLELYTLEAYKPVEQLKQLMEMETSAEKVLMSGSGPTVFGVYKSEKAARKACETMRKLRYEAYWASTMGK